MGLSPVIADYAIVYHKASSVPMIVVEQKC
jgi:hypothetical protein